MLHLTPALQNYAWGSRVFIQSLLGITDDAPLAEAWYGAHPKATSTIQGLALYGLIAADPRAWLGKKSGELPYLLKILAADQALSLQVHPDKEQAEAGFKRENKAGIALDSPQRNYRDPNHKPEFILALTDFEAMCGIRDFPQIVEIFSALGFDSFFFSFPPFAQNPTFATFKKLYQEILINSEIPGLSAHIRELSSSERYNKELRAIQRLNRLHPTDRTVLAPAFMNLITLRPNQGMHLSAGIPHAYLKGSGIEIMANSDNVLRAGLTPKHIDPDELLKIVNLQPFMPDILSLELKANKLISYGAKVPDFHLRRLVLSGEYTLPRLPGARILLCLAGNAELSQEHKISLSKGQSIILADCEQGITFTGDADIIIASRG